MAESMLIKDGSGTLKSLQVESGSYGYIPNHVNVSVATGSVVKKYYTDGPDGWEWATTSGSVSVASYDNSRRGLIISNVSEIGKCYVLVGSSSFGTISNVEEPPPSYSLLLDSGGTYFADTTSAVLEHMIYVPSSSNIPTALSMSVAVTQIY